MVVNWADSPMDGGDVNNNEISSLGEINNVESHY